MNQGLVANSGFSASGTASPSQQASVRRSALLVKVSP
jgi:hypothetical protein